MAEELPYIWISLFLISGLCASDSKHVQVIPTESSTVEYFFSAIPPSDGQSCDAEKKHILLLNGQFQQTSLRNNQLNEEAFGLRSDVRLLKLQLDTCSLIASASTGSYKTHLHIKMKQLLNMLDSDPFLILKIVALTGEVNTLQKQAKLAANSTESTTEHVELQRELREKITELNNATQQMVEKKTLDSALILQIISLQNQIWDLQQSESRRRGSNLQPDRRVFELQEELNSKLSELQSKGDKVNSWLLQLICVYSTTAALQKMISAHIKSDSSHVADIQRQRTQKVTLLKKKILQLNRDENNSQLTKEILKLQGEVEYLAQLMMDAKKSFDSILEELKRSVDEEKKQQEALVKQLEENDYPQAQLIIKVISILEEIREHQQSTSTGEANSRWAQFKDREREFAKAQNEINVLQQKLQHVTKSCLRPEENHVRLSIDHKVTELNQTGDSEAALILNVLNLLNEVKTLKERILAPENQDNVTEFHLNLERKQEELNTRTADIKRLTATGSEILQAVELINEIWDLQRKPGNETGSDQLKGLQDRLDGLISELSDRDNENIKLMMKIVLVQSKLEHLQRQLSDPEQILQPSQEAKLTSHLKAKSKDLETYISGLNKKNKTRTKLILNIIDLQKQLRELDREKHPGYLATAVIVTGLKEQLKVKEEEHARHQVVIKGLQDKLNHTEACCFGSKLNIKDLQNDLDVKLKELQSKSPSQTSLALQISELTVKLEKLKRQLHNTESKLKVKGLQEQMNEINQELDEKIEELKKTSLQPEMLLQIIAKQAEMDRKVDMASIDTDYEEIAVIQDHLKQLINGIQDENTKLTFQIMAQQDELETLKKQEENQKKIHAQEIKGLENELEDTRNQIEEKTVLLDASDMRIANLSAEIIDLHGKIKPLEDQILNLPQIYVWTLAGLQNRIKLTRNKQEDTELQLKNVDPANFDLIKEIVGLKAELKNYQEQTPRADTQQKINDLEEQLQNEQLEKRKLDRTNKDLKKQITDLKMCCTDVNSQCEDSKRRVQQSQEDADRLQQQLHDKDVALKQLQQEFEEQTRETSRLREENKNLQSTLKEVNDTTIQIKKMRLDPNTAHPRITLSAGNTEISITDDFQDIQDHPGRFNVVLGVLGTTGFSAGRHYWEVSVNGKNCYHLGMASESAPRRGSLQFKPANGFWTLILTRQGQYKALDGISVSIPLETRPVTLGILLDYKKGQISFYDANTRFRIYSFTGQHFTDKIHPFINFCVENIEKQSPIILLSPESADWIK